MKRPPVPEGLLLVNRPLLHGQRSIQDRLLRITNRDGSVSVSYASPARAEYLLVRYSRSGWAGNPCQRFLVEEVS